MPPKGKAAAGADCVKVCIRARPHTATDGGDNRTAVTINDEFGELICKDPDGKKGDKSYSFDTVFSPTADQSDVFVKVGQPMVDECLDGYNVTLFTYGQTGSGKTYTIQGLPGAGVRKDQDYDIDKHKGLTPRVSEYLYEKMGEVCEEDSSANTSVEMGYIEIYNEKVGDLLVQGNKDLAVREDAKGKPFVSGMTWKKCISSEQVMKHLLVGNTRRQVAATKMNEVSSRSHSIVVLKTKVSYDPPNPKKPDTESQLFIVDLAGSERQGKTGSEGETLNEAKNINKSLLMLGRAIHAFGESGAKAHVPLRDSVLTRLLKDSFGGNSKTWMIATCSASPYNMVETKSTLDYAANAKLITNSAEQNRVARALELGEQREMNKLLEQEIVSLKEELSQAEGKAEVRARKMAEEMSKGTSQTLLEELKEIKAENARLRKENEELLDTEAELRKTIAGGVKSDVSDQLRKDLDSAKAEIAHLKKLLDLDENTCLAEPTGMTRNRSFNSQTMKDLLDDPKASPEERLKRMEGRNLVESAGSFVRKKSFNQVFKQATGTIPKGAMLGSVKDISVTGGFSIEEMEAAKHQAVVSGDFAQAQRIADEIQTMKGQMGQKGSSMKELQEALSKAVSTDNFGEAQKLQAQINYLKMQQQREQKPAGSGDITLTVPSGDSYAPTATPRPGLDARIAQAMAAGGARNMFVGRVSISLKFLVAATAPPRGRYHTLPLEFDEKIDIDPSCPPQLNVNIYEMEKKEGTPDDGRMDFVVHVISAKGIPEKYTSSIHAKYVFKWGEKDNYKSDEVKGSKNPEFDYKKRFAFPKVTDQLRGWFNSENVLTFEVIALNLGSHADPTSPRMKARGAF